MFEIMMDEDMDADHVPACTPRRMQVIRVVEILAVFSVTGEVTGDTEAAARVARWLSGWLKNEESNARQ